MIYEQSKTSRLLNAFTVPGIVACLAVALGIYNMARGLPFGAATTGMETVTLLFIATVAGVVINWFVPRSCVKVTDEGVFFMKKGTVTKTFPFDEYDFEAETLKGAFNFIPYTIRNFCVTSKADGRRKVHNFSSYSTITYNGIFADINTRLRKREG